MVDKPRNPRRPAKAGGKRPADKGGPGERPKSFGRTAGKPVKGPARPERIGGVDARTIEALEREGLLSSEGRKLLGTHRGEAGGPARRKLSLPGGEGRVSRTAGRKGPITARGGEVAADYDDAPESRPARAPKRGTTPRPTPNRPAPGRRLTAPEKEVAERLHKVMAISGVASRRHSEELIQAGRVTVNGKVVTELGTKVVPSRDLVEVDGRRLGKVEEHVYILMNKPKGYVTTLYDPQGRQKVTDLLGDEVGQRVYPVGRLDYDTEGLLLLTNDGQLANALMHPSKQVKKTYIAKVRGVPGPAKIRALETGIELEDGMTAPAEVRILDVKAPNSATVSMRIHEGRNRQVRRMLEAVGHEVIHLKRTTLGPLHLRELALGQWRYLTESELREIKSAAGFKPPRGAIVAAITEERKTRGRRGGARFDAPEPAFEPGLPPVSTRGPRPARGPKPFAPGEERPASQARPARVGGPKPFADRPERPARAGGPKPFADRTERPARAGGPKPFADRTERPARPERPARAGHAKSGFRKNRPTK